MTEALWKARPMVAGRVGGIVAQIEDGETGWLVDSIARGVRRRRASRSSTTRPRRGSARCAGKEYVRRHFLTPRLLRDWLVLFNQLAGNDTAGAEVTVAA